MSLLLLLLTGCPSSDPDDTAAATCVEPVGITTCVVPAGATPGDELLSGLQLDATVVEVGEGAPPEGCLDPELWSGETTGTLDPTGAWWLVLEDGEGQRWTVAALIPGSSAPLAVGDDTQIAWTHGPFEPFAGDWGDRSLVVTDGDGTALVWAASAPTVEALPAVEGLDVARGDTTASCEEECYVEEQFALDVRVGAETGSVGVGGEADVGGYRVLVGDAWSAEDVTCSEQPEGNVSVALVAR